MSRRAYSQFCGLAQALDVLGERWTLLIVRNLLLGPLRYSELMHGLPGITTNLLAKRLKEMTEAGIIEKTRLAPSDRAAAYRLTPKGRDLEPAIHALGSWGEHRLAQAGPACERRLEWMLVSLRRRYLGGETLTAEVVASGVPYRFALTPEHADISRGTAERPDVRISGPPLALASLFVHGALAALPEAVVLDGERAALDRLLAAFRRAGPPAED
ncbi:MAG: helix-turn-helix domain-containing protein [Bacteroidota bacterium]